MFYIYDCNGTLIGNPNGYKSTAAALRVARNKRSKVYAYLNSGDYEQANEHLKRNGLFPSYSIRKGANCYPTIHCSRSVES